MKADDPNTRTDSSSDLPEALHHARPPALYTASGSPRAGDRTRRRRPRSGRAGARSRTRGRRTSARRRRTLSADDSQRHDPISPVERLH